MFLTIVIIVSFQLVLIRAFTLRTQLVRDIAVSVAPKQNEENKIDRKTISERALIDFQDNADDTINKILAVSLLIIPSILGWYVFRDTTPIVTPIEQRSELELRLINKSR